MIDTSLSLKTMTTTVLHQLNENGDYMYMSPEAIQIGYNDQMYYEEWDNLRFQPSTYVENVDFVKELKKTIEKNQCRWYPILAMGEHPKMRIEWTLEQESATVAICLDPAPIKPDEMELEKWIQQEVDREWIQWSLKGKEIVKNKEELKEQLCDLESKEYYTLTSAKRLLKKKNQIFLESHDYCVTKHQILDGTWEYIVSHDSVPIGTCKNVTQSWLFATEHYRQNEKPDEKEYEDGTKLYYTITSAIRLPKQKDQKLLESIGYVVKKSTTGYRLYYMDELVGTESSIVKVWKRAKEHSHQMVIR